MPDCIKKTGLPFPFFMAGYAFDFDENLNQSYNHDTKCRNNGQLARALAVPLTLKTVSAIVRHLTPAVMGKGMYYVSTRNHSNIVYLIRRYAYCITSAAQSGSGIPLSFGINDLKAS